MNHTENEENYLKIFLLAWVHGSQIDVVNVEVDTRHYRADLIEECKRQISTNPAAREIMREIAHLPIADLTKVMFEMKRIHDDHRQSIGDNR